MSAFKTPLFKTIILLAAALSGLCWAGFFEPQALEPPQEMLDGGYHLVEGEVLDRLGRGWTFEAHRVDGRELKARFLVYPPEAGNANWIPGARFVFWGRFQEAQPADWPGMFDWKMFLAREAITGEVWIDRSRDAQAMKMPASPLAWLHRLHENTLKAIQTDFKSRQSQALMAGLLLGDKRLLERSLKESFVRAGTMHLLVASGLHIALAFGFFLFIFSFFGIHRKAAMAVALTATWLFAVFIGLNPPVLRAVFMITVVALPGLRREAPAMTRLFLAALLLLAVRPQWIEDASFVLSFVSTFGILYGWSLVPLSVPKPLRIVASASGTSFFAWAALLPFSAAYFQEISLVAPISNLLLVPFSSLLLGCGAFYFSFLRWLPWAGPWLGSVLEQASSLFISIAAWFADFKFSSIASAGWDICLLCAWLAALCACAGQRRILAPLALVFLTFHAVKLWASPARIEVLAVEGRAAAASLDLGWSHIFCLASPAQSDFEKNRWRQFLKSRGRATLQDACAARSLTGTSSFVSLLPRLPFDQNQHLLIPCGQSTLIFPFSFYPARKETTWIEMLECPK